MTEKKQSQKQFSIQKLYIKDASFESPKSPKSFTFKQWDPKIELNLNNTSSQVEGDIFEAVLRVMITVTQNDQTAFLIEVQQAGLFGITGFDEQEREYLIASQCMNILFPYAREFISDLTTRGGFPPLVLSPVNFEALYQQHLQHKEQQSKVTDKKATDKKATDK